MSLESSNVKRGRSVYHPNVGQIVVAKEGGMIVSDSLTFPSHVSARALIRAPILRQRVDACVYEKRYVWRVFACDTHRECVFLYLIRETADFYAALEIRVVGYDPRRDVLEDFYASTNPQERVLLYENVSLLGTWSCVDLNPERNRDCRLYPADSVDRFFIFFCRLPRFSTTWFTKWLLFFGYLMMFEGFISLILDVWMLKARFVRFSSRSLAC